ncbi:hypothetical protein D3C73_1217360 [compost metagenome]
MPDWPEMIGSWVSLYSAKPGSISPFLYQSASLASASLVSGVIEPYVTAPLLSRIQLVGKEWNALNTASRPFICGFEPYTIFL